MTSESTDNGRGSALSSSQRLLWMGQRLNPDAPLYNMVLAFEIHGALDHQAFERAFQLLVDSSDSLRSRFEEHDGQPCRLVAESMRADLEFVDATLQDDPRAWFASFCAERSRRLLHAGDRLFDTALVRLGPDRHVWYLAQHHLITDGWSTALCHARMARFYGQIVAGEELSTAGLPQFADFVAFEAKAQGGKAHAKATQYWRDKASSPPEPSAFYGNPPRTATSSVARTERVECRLGRDRSAALRDLADQPGIRGLSAELAQFHLFMTALSALLHRVGGEHEELAVLAPMHGRPTAAFKETIGLFIEVFPLHLGFDRRETFDSLLAKVRREYQDVLVFGRPGTSAAAANPAYDVLLNFIPSKFGDFAGMPVASEWVHPGHGDPAHSLRLQVHDFDGTGEFTLHFDFNCDVFGTAERRATVRHFLAILDALLADRSRTIRHVDLVDPAEREQLLVTFNDTAQTAHERLERTVLDAFAAQVARTPAAAAIRCDGQTLSYAELDARANRLARHLQGIGMQRDSIVALLLDRSPEFVVAALAVQKAGAAYLPIDASFPPSRIDEIVTRSGARAVLSDARLHARLSPNGDFTTVLLDRDADAIAAQPDRPPSTAPAPADPAYVIYTSGSTGRPKGVVISHRALANYLLWARDTYTAGAAHDFAFFSPVAVDLTVTSLYVPLICGGAIAVYRSDDGDHDLSVLRVFDDDAVDIVKLTPAHLSLLLERGVGAIQRIRTLIVGGEDLKRRVAQRVHDELGDSLAIYNEYGPTEATVGCMIHRHDAERETGASVPIGRPIQGARIYLLDDRMQPVPRGVTGELWIGGAGLADGYLGAPELTKERFRDDPFVAGERIYRSGDLGRMDPATGDVMFGGRVDDQVKIKGARVELAEVQSHLEQHEGVASSVVVTSTRELVDRTDERARSWRNVRYCVRCGLASNHPEAQLDADDVCKVCHEYDGYRDAAAAYFRTPDDLKALFDRARAERSADDREDSFDCVMLLSGGKDSTYALYQLVHMGLKVLVFSLDNGFISESAKANIQRVVDHLGVELVFAKTPSMNAIFADSLERFRNVCQGCFKTIYTLATKLARERGIRHIVTGLSRGQIFETRLADFYRSGFSDADEIDRMIVEARKAYHRVDDAVARQLDVTLFERDEIFDEIQFVDFYRYWHVPLQDVLQFIAQHAAWTRPADTGRSTNCLINDTGIFVHKRDRGYHNYALPYSWDVRLGHKTREECLDELDDEIDEARVRRTLQEVGANLNADDDQESDTRLIAYFVPNGAPPTTAELRSFVSERLPAYMVPNMFVPIDSIPLSRSGKVDRAALPPPDGARTDERRAPTAPRNDVERALAAVWCDVLGLDSVSVHDDFLDLGGDSILSIQLVSRARAVGIRLLPRHVFAQPTIAELAEIAEVDAATAGHGTTNAPSTGSAELLPIQRTFLHADNPSPQHFGQSMVLAATAAIDEAALENAVLAVWRHHDALRLCFEQRDGRWVQSIGPIEQATSPRLVRAGDTDSVEDIERQLLRQFDLRAGCLLAAAIVRGGKEAPDRCVLVVHHLAIDAVSWSPLLADLESAYDASKRAVEPALPAKTAPWLTWAAHLHEAARAATNADCDEWTQSGRPALLPLDHGTDRAPGRRSSERSASARLDSSATNELLAARTDRTGATIAELLTAALSHTLAQWAGDSGVIRIDLEGHGRDDPRGAEVLDNSRTVGWFTTVYPIEVATASNAGDTLRAARERMGKVQDGGHGFGLLHYPDVPNVDAAHRQRLGALPAAEILFNYLGRAPNELSGSQHFRIARGLAVAHDEEAQRTHLLESHAVIERDELVLTVTYNADRHDHATIEQLARDVLALAHSLADEQIAPSPTDFPEADLSQSELDSILKDYGD